jgi:formylmethanofuran dehydrogenase subunit C
MSTPRPDWWRNALAASALALVVSVLAACGAPGGGPPTDGSPDDGLPDDGAPDNGSPTVCLPSDGFDRTWLGAVSDDWSDGDNWSPAGAPTNEEHAYVCGTDSGSPALTAATAVGALTVAPGAQVRLGAFTLSVHGDLDLAAGSIDVESGSLRVVGDGAVLRGTLPTVTINALTVAGGPLTVDGNLTLGLDRAAHLDPNGHPLTVLGNLATVSVGCLVSTRPEDRVVIHGSATLNGWDNQAHCALTAGTLELRGDLTTTVDQLFSRLTPDAGHRTLLAGTTPQTVTIGGLALGHPQGNRFHDLEIANPAGVTFTQPVDVRGDVIVDAAAGTVGGDTTLFLDGGLLEPNGGQRWQVTRTDLRGPERTVALPASVPNDLVVNGLLRLQQPLTVMGDLTIATATLARLDPGPHTLTVHGDLATVSGQNVNGCLAMTEATAHVLVHGRTTLNGWTNSQGCEMRGGTLELRGDLTTTAGQQFSRLSPDAGHRTLLAGTTPQTVTIGGLALGHPQGNRFHDLEIANPAGITFTQPVDVRGDVRFTDTAGTLTSAATVFLDGSVHEPLGGERWRVPTTDLRGLERDLVLPATLHGNLIVNAHLVLDQPLTVTGNVTIGTATGASFDAGPDTLTVQGDLTTFNGANVNGCLAMTAPTTHVIVHGNARFNGYTSFDTQRCGMSDGTLELLGDFSTAAVWNSMFTPVGSHLVRLRGAGIQEVAFGGTADHPQGNRFQSVEIVNTAGVTFTLDARVHGQLELVGQLKNEAVLTIPFGGSLLLRSGSYLDNLLGSIALGGTCTAEAGADGVGIPPACLVDCGFDPRRAAVPGLPPGGAAGRATPRPGS